MSNQGPFEIEHKYLVAYPDLELIKKKPGLRVLELHQIYLTSGKEGQNRRIRRCREDGRTSYIYTEKKKLSDLKRIETEYELTEEEAQRLLLEADDRLHPIEKTRYAYPEAGFVYELDIFPFWKNQAYLEVEVVAEDVEVPFPKEYTLLREVTQDSRYTNHALAKEIPAEDVFHGK